MTFRLIGCIAIWLASASSVFAYIPPSEFIMKKWFQKRNNAQNMIVLRKVTLLSEGQPTSVSVREELWIDVKSGTYVGRFYDEQKRELYSYEKRVSDQSKDAEAVLFFGAQSREAMSWLQKNHIPVKTETELMRYLTEEERLTAEAAALRRFHSKVQWAFEEQTSSPFKSSLWMEKDSFLPSRVTFRHGDQPLELEFNGFQYYREAVLPKEVRYVKEAKPVVSVELLDARINGAKKLALGRANGWTPIGEQLGSEQKQLIEAMVQELR